MSNSESITGRILEAMNKAGFTFSDVGQAVGRSEVDVASILFRRKGATAGEAQEIVRLLGLPKNDTYELVYGQLEGNAVWARIGERVLDKVVLAVIAAVVVGWFGSQLEQQNRFIERQIASTSSVRTVLVSEVQALLKGYRELLAEIPSDDCNSVLNSESAEGISLRSSFQSLNASIQLVDALTGNISTSDAVRGLGEIRRGCEADDSERLDDGRSYFEEQLNFIVATVNDEIVELLREEQGD